MTRLHLASRQIVDEYPGTNYSPAAAAAAAPANSIVNSARHRLPCQIVISPNPVEFRRVKRTSAQGLLRCKGLLSRFTAIHRVSSSAHTYICIYTYTRASTIITSSGSPSRAFDNQAGRERERKRARTRELEKEWTCARTLVFAF